MQFLKRIMAGLLAGEMLLSGCSLSASAESRRVYYRGDVNVDGVIDLLDVIALQKYILGYGPLTNEAAALCADANGDGSVDVYDLGVLRRYVVNEIREEALGEKFISAPLKDFYGTMPSQGSGRMIVFYVDFPDCPYDYAPTAQELSQICFGTDDNTEDLNYPFNSMRSFYRRASKGSFDLTGTVCRYTAKHEKAYYEVGDDGNVDEEKTRLLTELFQYFNRSLDFSEFDGNKDGYIDDILVSVPKAAGDKNWWPCTGFNYSKLEADGVHIGHVTTGFNQVVSAEDHREFVSIYLHETGHCMGLSDYYLFYSEDNEGFHGTTAPSMMHSDNYSDFNCFSKLMLGWYRKRQVQVFDTSKNGAQTFLLTDAQSDAGNCLLLPCGSLDANYNSEYILLEYCTDTANNSGINRDKGDTLRLESGVRAYHVYAEAEELSYGIRLAYRNGGAKTNKDDDGIRLIRQVNEAEGGSPFTEGDVLDGSLSGFHWYAEDESESVETGYTVTIGELADGSYTVTVNYAGA